MQSVHDALNEHLDEMVKPKSSIIFFVNPSMRLFCTKYPSKTVAVIITLTVHGHKDGGKLFTDRTNLDLSIVEGVKNYVIDMKDLILAQFNSQFTDVTEIK